MPPATTFKWIKLTSCLLSEAEILVACISQQGQSTESFYQCCTGKFDFSHDIIVLANWMHIFGKTRYGLEHATGNLHSKFCPILTNIDQVLQSYAVNELKHA